jgi:hypothetical protein
MKMRLNIFFTLYTFIFFGTFLAPLQAQETKTEKERAVEQAVKIKSEGALIFCMQSKHRKVDALEKRIAKSAGARRKAYEEQLAATLKKRNKINAVVQEELKSTFDFCKVYFMYDTAVIAFKKGQRNQPFIGANGTVDSLITFDEKEAVFLFYIEKALGKPTDGLLLESPTLEFSKRFPTYRMVRASWIDQVNRKGIRRGLYSFNQRLKTLSTQ